MFGTPVEWLCGLVFYTALVIRITYVWTKEYFDDPSYREYLKSDKWKTLRAAVLKRDKYTCQNCGSKNKLQVHHKTYDRIFKESMDDLITLCADCHKKVEQKVKGARQNVKKVRRKSTSTTAGK